jgi:hypothetical protein
MVRHPNDKRPPHVPTPKEPKLWDKLPPPAQGDKDAHAIYAAMGKALDIWNQFEEALAQIFSFMVSESDTEPAERAYGSVVMFRGRKEMVEATADAFFFLRPETGTNFHSALKKLLLDGLNFAPRRNEIAHGVLRHNRSAPDGWPLERYIAEGILSPESLRPHPMRPLGFVLCPSDVASVKNQMEKTDFSLFPITYIPDFAYSSAEILIFSERFNELRRRAMRFPLAILQHRKMTPRT